MDTNADASNIDTSIVSDEAAAQARALLKRYEAEQFEKRKRALIQCAACPAKHPLGNLDAIATHWYVRPSGCTDGDYWVEGDFHFVCPHTGVRNRIFFWDSYDDREAGINAGDAFKQKYRSAFNSITNEYTERTESVNNDYVDKNRTSWGLPEKKA